MNKLIPRLIVVLSFMACSAIQGQSLTGVPARLSGNLFLSNELKQIQQEINTSPLSIWIDRGIALWQDKSSGNSCEGCHGPIENLKIAAVTHPKLSPDGNRLENLEDRIAFYLKLSRGKSYNVESDEVLALSAAIHSAADGVPIQIEQDPFFPEEWNSMLAKGATLYATRQGRMNLSCTNCHDQNIGKNLRNEVISPGNPTSFPIYRMTWQKLGSIDRRLRACYFGIQAKVPDMGSQELRSLELFLMNRAQGLPIDGPSLRR